MAFSADSLKRELESYMGGHNELKLRLWNTPNDVKVDCLNVVIDLNRHDTAVMAAVERNDEKTLRCMMFGVNAKLKATVLEKQDIEGWTAFHYAVSVKDGNDRLVQVLLDGVEQSRLFDVLKIQSKNDKETALHIACRMRRQNAHRMMWRYLNEQQQNELLTLTNVYGQTICPDW